jgi:hypothetical protein
MTLDEIIEQKIREFMVEKMDIYMNAERYNNRIKIVVELRVNGQTICSDSTDFVLD